MKHAAFSFSCRWSEYYHAYSVLYQIGITGGGCGVLPPRGQSPRLEDTEQAVLAGVLEFVHRNGCILVDKGYRNFRAIAAQHGIRVAMPTKKPTNYKRNLKRGMKKKKLARPTIRRNRHVSKGRIHVERKMSRLKNFKLLTNKLPVEYKDILDDMIWCAVCLGNYGVGLTTKNYEETVGSRANAKAEAARAARATPVARPAPSKASSTAASPTVSPTPASTPASTPTVAPVRRAKKSVAACLQAHGWRVSQKPTGAQAKPKPTAKSQRKRRAPKRPAPKRTAPAEDHVRKNSTAPPAKPARVAWKLQAAATAESDGLCAKRPRTRSRPMHSTNTGRILITQ